MRDYKRIIAECFWDLKISGNDIDNIIKSNDMRQKRFLFEKILLNSSRLFHDLCLFKNEEIELLLGQYIPSGFNFEYASRRLNLAEVYFLNKPVSVDELQWIA